MTHKEAVQMMKSIQDRLFMDQDVRNVAKVLLYVLKTMPHAGEEVDE